MAKAKKHSGLQSGEESLIERRPPRRGAEEILDDVEAVVWEMHPQTWTFTYVSRYAEWLLGYPLENWYRPGFWAERVHPADSSETIAACEAAIQRVEDHMLEYRLVAADGRPIWVRDSVIVKPGADGKAALICGVLVDITDLKTAELAKRASEERFQRFAEISTECVIIHNDGIITEVNEACERMLGYPAYEMIGRMGTDFCIPEDRARLLEHIASAASEPLYGTALRKDGSVFSAELQGRTILMPDGARRVVTMRDVTARLRVEEALEAATLDYHILMDEVSEAIIVTDPQLRLIRVNRRTCVLAGLSETQMLGRHIEEFIDPRELAVSPLRVERLNPGESLRTERLLRASDGREIVADISAKRLLDGRVLASIHDVTDQRKAEASLRQSEMLFEKAFKTSRDAVVLYRLRDLLLLDVNDAWAKATGISREEALGHSQTEFGIWADESQLQLLLQELSTKGVVRDFPFVFLDGQKRRRFGELSAEVISMGGEACALAIIRDVTDQMRLEQHLRHTQKLEAIGGLAGGIAHDFNNILTAIKAFSELAIGSLPVENSAREDVEQILKAADRAAALTRQLLAFSRQQVHHKRIFAPNAVVTDMEPMLRRLVGDNCTLRVSLSSEEGLVNADPSQVEQVLLNLVVNGRDAMPDGGVIDIVTTNEDFGAYDPVGGADCPTGAQVSIAVSDTGVGMDERTRERIFEPFFTTKGNTGGTGLGLSTVYGIVKQSSGNVEVTSEPGKGSKFRILLPRVFNSGIRAADEPNEGLVPPRAGAIILVVDDESSIRKVVRRILTRNGYQVIDVGSGAEALALFTDPVFLPDLVLTDISMPGMRGNELLAALRGRGYDRPALFMTGFAEARPALSSAPVLHKPFAAADLLRSVEVALSATALPISPAPPE